MAHDADGARVLYFAGATMLGAEIGGAGLWAYIGLAVRALVRWVAA